MEWTDLRFIVPVQYAENAQAAATSVANAGIYVEDYSDMEQQVLEIAHIDLIDESLLAKSKEQVIVHVYVAPDENAVEISQLIASRMLAGEVPYTLETTGVMQEDWESSWKQYYHAIDIGKRLAIVPSWETYDTERVQIILDPGMAFGTGTHETTNLCLRVLDELVQGGERVLDIGTGSGILAIAALKLGANSAEGVDIDPMCVRTAGENAQRNGVQNDFTVLIGDLSDKASGTYDIICANIVAGAIKMLTPAVPPLMAPNALYIASGIIDERKDEVLQVFAQCNLQPVQVFEENGWVAIVAKKHS